MASSSSPVLLSQHATTTHRDRPSSMSHHHSAVPSSSSVSDAKSQPQHIDHHRDFIPASPSSFLSSHHHHHVHLASSPVTSSSPIHATHFQPAHPSTPPLRAHAQQATGGTLTTTSTTSNASSRASSARPSPHLGPNASSSAAAATVMDSSAPKPFPTLGTAVGAFEDALLDLADSSSEEEEDDDDEDEGIEELKLGASASALGGSASANAAKTSKRGGWAKGAAKEAGGAAFHLVVDVPVWTPDCFADLSTMHSLRDRTLRTLHNVIDDLKIRAGVRTTYRLLSTAQGGAWGCIRVAPLASRSSSSSSSAADRAGTSARRSATNGRPAVASRNTLDSVEKSSSGVGAVLQGFPRTLAVNRRTTLAAVDKGRPVGRLATGESNLVADAQAALDDDKNKRETGERVRDAVDKDARGNIDEGRYYVLAVGGQPALVIT